VTRTRPGAEPPAQPTSIYGLHKLTVEHYHRSTHPLRGALCRRPPDEPVWPVQAPERKATASINEFIISATRGEDITLYGDGSQSGLSSWDVIDAIRCRPTEPSNHRTDPERGLAGHRLADFAT